MSTPLRIDDHIVLRARLEAEATDRSLTGQIEHWVKLGIALEEVLGHRQALELKRHGSNVPLGEALTQAGGPDAQELALRQLPTSAGPRYGVDPEHPGFLLRIDADGTRTRGRFVNRAFVPVEPSAD